MRVYLVSCDKVLVANEELKDFEQLLKLSSKRGLTFLGEHRNDYAEIICWDYDSDMRLRYQYIRAIYKDDNVSLAQCAKIISLMLQHGHPDIEYSPDLVLGEYVHVDENKLQISCKNSNGAPSLTSELEKRIPLSPKEVYGFPDLRAVRAEERRKWQEKYKAAKAAAKEQTN